MPIQTATRWERICADPSLRDLPYKVETNASGQIILSPHTNRHSILQSEIDHLLRELIGAAGVYAVEFAVETPEGTKVPDVVWISSERFQPDAAASPVVPELCVEVLSDSNLRSEIDQMRRLYFESGAEEVWIVNEEGAITFYGPDGRMPASKRVEGFPERVEPR